MALEQAKVGDNILATVNRIINGVNEIELTPGPKGATGAKGATGDAGPAGKDGFGTEAQYNDIIARLTALETPTGE